MSKNQPRIIKQHIKGFKYNKSLSTSFNYILYVGTSFLLTKEQLDASKRIIHKFTREYRIRAYPHLASTFKPVSTRMGKGKGAINQRLTRIRPGTILFEFKFKAPEEAHKCIRLLRARFKTELKMVKTN